MLTARYRSIPVLLGLLTLALAAAEARSDERKLDLHRMARVPGETSDANYYQLEEDASGLYLHADYRPGLDTMKRGISVTDAERKQYHWLQWRWRALTPPAGGDECGPDDQQDSVASLYLGWRRGLRWYSVKYVWASVSPKGTLCRRIRNPFVASDTVVLESGGPFNAWVTETVDFDQVFRDHFADGDPHADIPNFIGFMVLTDGDQTHSPASADYGGFTLSSDKP